MAVLILLFKIYFIFIIVLMTIYAIRHYILTGNRLHHKQKIAYGDIYDSELPYVSILVPMRNEEMVLNNVLSALLKCDYDKDRLEIIAINDHSSDKTRECWIYGMKSIRLLTFCIVLKIIKHEEKCMPSMTPWKSQKVTSSLFLMQTIPLLPVS